VPSLAICAMVTNCTMLLDLTASATIGRGADGSQFAMRADAVGPA
jgi:hypothetical protein